MTAEVLVRWIERYYKSLGRARFGYEEPARSILVRALKHTDKERRGDLCRAVFESYGKLPSLSEIMQAWKKVAPAEVTELDSYRDPSRPPKCADCSDTKWAWITVNGTVRARRCHCVKEGK